jgi:hypothetical protein
MGAHEDEARRLFLHGTGQLKQGEEQFDPELHTVAQVLSYLESADAGEARRVVKAEAAGKARKSVLEA